MNRVLLFVVMVLLPLQMVWAAAAPYCAHESSAAQAKHLGHHEHEHEHEHASGDAPAAVADDGAAPGLASIDTDCASCQLASSATLPAATRGFVRLQQGARAGDPAGAYRSHVPSGPERPDRFELPAAVRFGGGVGFGLHPA